MRQPTGFEWYKSTTARTEKSPFPGEGVFAPPGKKSPEPIGSGGFLFCFSLREQVGHALQADAQGGHMVKQGRGRWGQEARHAAARTPDTARYSGE